MSDQRLGASVGGPKGGLPLGSTRDSGAVAYIVAMVGAAKERLMTTHGAVLETERRTRDWDVSEPFLARRGLALRQAARRAFAVELENTKETLEQVARTLKQKGQGNPRSGTAAFSRADDESPVLPTAVPSQEAIVEARRQLRALHQLFGGNELPLSLLLGELDRAFLSTT